VVAPDIRAGAALVVAGLAASGITEIGDVFHIDRGYDDLVGRLSALGASVSRIQAQ
jgi:UDP-N-acetylglucosamine 1-carboxyvinyltransferase